MIGSPDPKTQQEYVDRMNSEFVHEKAARWRSEYHQAQDELFEHVAQCPDCLYSNSGRCAAADGKFSRQVRAIAEIRKIMPEIEEWKPFLFNYVYVKVMEP